MSALALDGMQRALALSAFPPQHRSILFTWLRQLVLDLRNPVIRDYGFCGFCNRTRSPFITKERVRTLRLVAYLLRSIAHDGQTNRSEPTAIAEHGVR